MLLVNTLDENEFSVMVKKIFENAELAENLSKEARKTAEKFSWTYIKPEWTKLLQVK